MTDTEENIVEPDVTGFGNPSLEADKVDDSTDSTIDNLLDEVIKETEGDTNEPSNEVEEKPVEDLLADEGSNTGTQEANPVVEPTPAEAKPAEPVNDTNNAGVEIDPEIASIEQPRNLSEKNQSNWRKLQETASIYKKQAAEAEALRQKLAEAESRPAQTPEDYAELKKFRQIFDIKNDPEFRSKYETPIKTAKETVYGILRKHGANDEIIQSIEKAGGPDKIADSFWKQPAFAELPFTDGEKLKRSLVDVADLKEKQEQEIAYAAENAEQILQQREESSRNWYQQEVQSIDQHIDELTKDIPWARYAEATPDATPEQLQQIQQHNAKVSDLAKKFESALWPTTAQERANIAASAVFSHVLTEQLRTEQTQKNALMEQVKTLQAENSKLKSSSRMPKQTVATTATNKTSSLNDRIKMNASDAIDIGLDEALG